MCVKICEHCKREYRRSGRPEQRFCSHECFRLHRYGAPDQRADRRCECCPTVFSTAGRRKNKRFCSMRCVSLWREREKRLNRKPESPRNRPRKKPGRLEWSIFGAQRGRGMDLTSRDIPNPVGWVRLLTRLGYPRVGSLRELDRLPRPKRRSMSDG